MALSPARFGAGLKIKVLEALANGCRVLATSHSVEGFPKGIHDVVTIEDNFENWTKGRLQQSVAVKKADIKSYIDNYFTEDIAKSILKEVV